ncbi:MAG: gliding-motility protein MglA [Myxococcales bacterium]|nr:gliding-motility protein MglA [Myxococcales bacterium]
MRMPFIHRGTGEVVFKLVYCGVGMGGKTTNIVQLHRMLKGRSRELVTLDNADDRTVFFDFLPLTIVDGWPFRLRFNLYSVPGQHHYQATRRVLLRGADGIVFVVDSQVQRLPENLQSFRQTLSMLVDSGWHVGHDPLVVQYNKRDCPKPVELGVVESRFGLGGCPRFEATASEGLGVVETIRAVAHRVVERFEP